jgi:hypothetical protein
MMKRNHVSWTATTERFSVTRSTTAKVRAIVPLARMPLARMPPVRVPLVAAILMLAGVLTAAPFVGAFAQNAPAAGDATPAPASRPAGGLNVLEFKPAMDDLMTMLVQPRHIKIYYAGQAKNWTLAGFELNELRGALARIGRTIPTYRNVGVDMAVTTIIADKIKALDAAIKAKDSEQFTATYAEVTAACNTCHQALDHPFLKITVPDAANYPDQDFRP